MKLAEVQKLFATALQAPEPQASAAVIAAGSAKMKPEEQLEVYREQFWIRHHGCLAEDFPTLRALIGEASFERLVERYLEAHPPRSFMLRDLGENMADFVRADSGERLLYDVARVEWAFVSAFDAADAPPLDPSSLANATDDDWPRARITFHPSVIPLELEYPAEELRVRQRTGEALSRPERDPRGVVVYRKDLLLYAERVDLGALAVIAALARGVALEQACEQADGAGELVGEWFARWAALGWIARVSFSDA